MPAPTLSTISVFPIKSTAPIHQSRAWVELKGLAFDRRFVVTDHNGQFMTGRKHPKLAKIAASLLADGLQLEAPGQSPLRIGYQEFSDRYLPVQVWGDSVQGQHCGDSIDQWFSQYLETPCRLLFFGEQVERPMELPGKCVSYADAYPLLLISEASLEHLNSRLPQSVSMDRFRPNLVVKGCEPFAEDRWKRIRIGQVEFEISKPCSRCVFTTLDPITGEFDSNKEPLTTLLKYRRGSEPETRNEVFFGQNLIALNEGTISLEDPVEVLETQIVESYPDNWTGLGNSPAINNGLQPAPSATAAVEVAQPEGPIALRCINIIEETPDVKTFRFHIETGLWRTYLPGQYLTLLLNIDGKPIRRCYTLSSSPTRGGHFSITVKRVDDGLVSNWLHDNLTVGSEIEALPPSGDFHWYAADRIDKALLLSAGSGITPMLSMARYLSDTQSDADTVFIHSARTEADLISRQELDLLAKQHSRLSLAYTLTGDAKSHWQGGRGRLSREQLLQAVPDIADYTVFVCGPNAFMDHAKQLLSDLGVPDERYFEESFGVPVEALDDSSAKEQEDERELSLLFDSWDTQVVGDNRRTLLEQGEAAGVDLAYSCRAGVCGQCKVKVVSGDYQSSADDALSPQEREQNYVLACCCKPLSDMVIEAG